MSDKFHIQWHITDMCNLRCRHCYQENFSKSSELSLDELKIVLGNVISTIKKWRKRLVINVTGGEPLLKNDLFPLMELLDNETEIIELAIITNGLFINSSSLEKLSHHKKLKTLKISIDGANEKTNDSIRGNGTFKKIIENINLVKDNYDFKIILMFTLMKKNYREIPQLIDLAESLNVDGIILERFIPLGTGKKIKEEVLSKNDWKEVLEILSSIFAINHITELASYHAFYLRLDTEETELLGAPCIIGRDGLCVMPDGSVLPCRRFPIPIGNLLDRSLIQIWENSELLKKLTDKYLLKGKCKKCPIEDCTGCRSMALSITGDFLAEDPHCILY